VLSTVTVLRRHTVMMLPRMESSWSLPAGSGERWAEDYERGRPGWPPGVVDVPDLAASATVLEVGAGTGKLTRLLAGTFARVVAVEPADAMRRRLVALCPDAEALDGAAEAIPLADGSVAAAFAAEAFHKFDGERAVPELARVLRPGGVLVLMWNLPAGPVEPSIAAAELLLRERGPAPEQLDYEPLDLNPRAYSSDAWRRPFAGSAFGSFESARLPNPQTLDREGMVAFLASMGWIGDLDDAERLPLLDELRSLLPAREYTRLWETRVHWARRT
jgi:SAM-dependent methyltransferase